MLLVAACQETITPVVAIKRPRYRLKCAMVLAYLCLSLADDPFRLLHSCVFGDDSIVCFNAQPTDHISSKHLCESNTYRLCLL